jgi:hypothetical protein
MARLLPPTPKPTPARAKHPIACFAGAWDSPGGAVGGVHFLLPAQSGG